MNIQGMNPMLMAPVSASTAVGTKATSNASSSSSSSTGFGGSASSLQSTFLNLLVTELQNQDPTQPVDPTAMVGQMVSLNQLDQLISINQTLSNLTSGAAATPGTNSGGATATPQAAAPAHSTSTKPVATPATTSFQGANPIGVPPSDGSGLMNLYGSFGLTQPPIKSMYTGVR